MTNASTLPVVQLSCLCGWVLISRTGRNGCIGVVNQIDLPAEVEEGCGCEEPNVVYVNSRGSSEGLMLDISSPHTDVGLTGIGEVGVDTIRSKGKLFQFRVSDEANGLYIEMVVLFH